LTCVLFLCLPQNFGTGSNYSVSVNGVTLPSSTVVYVNATMMTFVAPRGIGSNIPISLVVATLPSTYTAPALSYIPPSISVVSGCAADVSPRALDCSILGQVITVAGSNFGNTSSALSVSVNSVSCTGPTITVADSQLTCMLQANPYGGFLLNVNVSVGGQSSGQPYLSFLGPVISPLTLTLGALPQSSTGSVVLTSDPLVTGSNVQVAFSGRNFGLNASAITVYVGPAGQPTLYTCAVNPSTLVSSGGSAGASNISCFFGGGIGLNMLFTVQVGYLVSPVGTDTLTTIRPYIIPGTLRETQSPPGATDYTGRYSSGDLVFFDVQHLGTLPLQITVTYSSAANPSIQQCTGVTLYPLSNGNTTIRCLTQTGSGAGYHFTVTVVNYASLPGTDTYNYAVPPTISSVYGCNNVGNGTTGCSTLGGQVITVTGTGYGSTAFVRIGSSTCTIISTSESVLTCTAPAGSGLLQAVTVVRELLFSQSAYLFSYATATITSVSGCTDSGSSTANCPRTGSTVVTIQGSNFGPPTPIVLIGGSPCSPVVQDATSPSTKLTCTLSSGSQASLSVMLIQAGGPQTTGSVTLSYAQCAAGSYSVGTDIACTLCSNGTFQDVAGQQSCKPCPDGSFSAGPGNIACTQCQQATYSLSNGVGATTCTSCAQGTYNSLPGQATCTSCPAVRIIAHARGLLVVACVVCCSSFACVLCVPRVRVASAM